MGRTWGTIGEGLRSEYTKEIGPEITLYTCIREVFGSNLGQDSSYPEVFRGFSQPSYKFTERTSIWPRMLPSIRRYMGSILKGSLNNQ